jgi:hypothetical protein
VHPNQINPNAQMDALLEVQKAAGKKEVEHTRKKLLDKAGALHGESDYVVKLGARDQSQEQGKPKTQQEQVRKQKKEQTRVASANNRFPNGPARIRCCERVGKLCRLAKANFANELALMLQSRELLLGDAHFLVCMRSSKTAAMVPTVAEVQARAVLQQTTVQPLDGSSFLTRLHNR